MSQVASTDELVTKTDLATFYQGILPYLGGMPEMVANKFTKSDLYSADEKIIGQWLDGKPLYQKCYSCTTPSSTSGYHTIITLDSDIEPKKLDGWLVQNNIPINCYASSSYRVITQYKASTNVIEQQVSGYTSQAEIVVLQYTKSTDSAISIGSDTDYSTDEKIIGTWLDGKPLYQQTFAVAVTTQSAKTVKTYNLISDNTIKMRNAFGSFERADGNIHNILHVNANQNDGSVAFSVMITQDSSTGVNLLVKSLGALSTTATAYCTVQYTKSTD